MMNKIKFSPALAIACYAIQYGKWATPRRAPWRGQEVDLHCYISQIQDREYLAFQMQWDGAKFQKGFHHLGLIGDNYKAYLFPGWTKRMKIYSQSFENDRNPIYRSPEDKTTRIILFDSSMTDEEIKQWRTRK